MTPTAGGVLALAGNRVALREAGEALTPAGGGGVASAAGAVPRPPSIANAAMKLTTKVLIAKVESDGARTPRISAGQAQTEPGAGVRAGYRFEPRLDPPRGSGASP